MSFNVCSICFNTSSFGDKWDACECGHVFHSACLDRWVDTRKKNTSFPCPSCMQNSKKRIKLFLECNNDSVSDEQQELNHRIDLLSGQVSEKTKDIKQLKENLYFATAARDELKRELNDYRSKFVLYEKEILGLKNLFADLKKEKGYLEKENNDFKKLISFLKKGPQKNPKEDGDFINYNDPIIAETCVVNLRSDLKRSEESCKQLAKQSSVLNSENLRLNAENSDLKKKNETYLAVIESLKERMMQEKEESILISPNKEVRRISLVQEISLRSSVEIKDPAFRSVSSTSGSHKNHHATSLKTFKIRLPKRKREH